MWTTFAISIPSQEKGQSTILVKTVDELAWLGLLQKLEEQVEVDCLVWHLNHMHVKDILHGDRKGRSSKCQIYYISDITKTRRIWTGT